MADPHATLSMELLKAAEKAATCRQVAYFVAKHTIDSDYHGVLSLLEAQLGRLEQELTAEAESAAGLILKCSMK